MAADVLILADVAIQGVGSDEAVSLQAFDPSLQYLALLDMRKDQRICLSLIALRGGQRFLFVALFDTRVLTGEARNKWDRHTLKKCAELISGRRAIEFKTNWTGTPKKYVELISGRHAVASGQFRDREQMGQAHLKEMR